MWENKEDMTKYPIGIQSFSELRTGNYLYVDKTEIICQLFTQGKTYFLSRPRRFGKSLLLNTLKSICKGEQSLFQGLWIYDKIEWLVRPVIHISFTNIGLHTQGLENGLYAVLREIATEYEIVLEDVGYDQQFQELIKKLYKKTGQKVAILIDEYDTPITDFLVDDIEHAKRNQRILKSFYSVVKNLDEYIFILFITGVSKFARVSIFSDLNHLDDITFDKRFATVCGYTQQELEAYFSDSIREISQIAQLDILVAWAEVKKWYNGYTWDGETSVYNPFSILNFAVKKQFSNYWFESGTPTFLVKSINAHFDYDLENQVVGDYIFKSYDLDNVDYRAILFQTGYITIKEIRKGNRYVLSYPNKEVRDSMMYYLLGDYVRFHPGDAPVLVYDIKELLEDGELEKVMKRIDGLFSKIPSELFKQNYENFYHAIVFITFRLVGTLIDCEVSHRDGRIDAVVQTDKYIYIFEFKVNQSAEIALKQIKDNQYYSPFIDSGKEIHLVGVNFTAEKKGVEKWISEEHR